MRMTTKDLAQEYLIEAPKGYRFAVELFIEKCPSDPTKISRETWDVFRASLESKYKQTTVRDKLTKAKCFLNDLSKRGLIKINIRRLKVPLVLSRKTVALEDEIECMEKSCNKNEFLGLQDYLLLQCMRTGMRIQEIHNLNREDIAHAQMFRSKDGSTRYYTRIISAKSLQERVIMIPTETYYLFLKYIEVLVKINPNPELFPSLENMRMSTRTIERRFDRIKVRANITSKITPHSVRHMRAHAARKLGADLMTVQLILGHRNAGSTANYLQLDMGEKLESLDKYS